MDYKRNDQYLEGYGFPIFLLLFFIPFVGVALALGLRSRVTRLSQGPALTYVLLYGVLLALSINPSMMNKISTAIANKALTCSNEIAKKTYIKILEKQYTTFASLPPGGPSGPRPPNAYFYLYLFPSLMQQLILDVAKSPPDAEGSGLNAISSFDSPTLSLQAVRTQPDGAGRLNCQAELVGNFGHFGDHRIAVSYSVEITDDGQVYVTAE